MAIYVLALSSYRPEGTTLGLLGAEKANNTLEVDIITEDNDDCEDFEFASQSSLDMDELEDDNTQLAVYSAWILKVLSIDI